MVFRFKNFSVKHSQSAIKVGVDAVLLGAWTKALRQGDFLDVGTGCGVIALILAFRYPGAKIEGIDIHTPSVEEAAFNFQICEYSNNLKASLTEFPVGILERKDKYDLIVSNPPYFSSGIINPSTPREKARHQGNLSVFSLLENASSLLHWNGLLSIIFPIDYYEGVLDKADKNGLVPYRECRVRDNMNRPEKRVMMELINNKQKGGNNWPIERLVLFEDKEPTQNYRELCKDLYLKF